MNSTHARHTKDADTLLSLNVRAGGRVAWANDEDVFSLLGGAV